MTSSNIQFLSLISIFHTVYFFPANSGIRCMQIKSGYQLSLKVQRTPTTDSCETAKIQSWSSQIHIYLVSLYSDTITFASLLLNGFASQKRQKCGPIVADDNLDMTFVTKDFPLDLILLYLKYFSSTRCFVT